MVNFSTPTSKERKCFEKLKINTTGKENALIKCIQPKTGIVCVLFNLSLFAEKQITEISHTDRNIPEN